MEIKEPQPLVSGGKFPVMSDEDLENRFSFHPTNSSLKQEAHQSVREEALEFAKFIRNVVPPGREQALAITNLEEVMFWANAGIARK